jgi:glycosyltransferase involved in cell wall biosynthesis
MNSAASAGKPAVTIITPSFNQGAFIRRTIESVMAQGVPALEHLVFDGGSTDETTEVLKSCNHAVSWISQPDRGQTHAVNKGLIAARGDIIGWLNSDDIYYPGAVMSVMNFFNRHPDVEILYGMADHIDEHDNCIEPYYNEPWDYERLKEICFICQPAVFFRRSVVERYGLLDEGLRYCMDYEYWLRVGRETPFYYLEQKLAGSRLYRETKTLGSAVPVHQEILAMLKKRVGTVPGRWIFGYAHVVARESGLTRETPQENLRFVKKVALSSFWTFLRLRHGIPLVDLKTIFAWLLHARRTKGR